jgi:hypothetical protein
VKPAGPDISPTPIASWPLNTPNVCTPSTARMRLPVRSPSATDCSVSTSCAISVNCVGVPAAIAGCVALAWTFADGVTSTTVLSCHATTER